MSVLAVVCAYNEEDILRETLAGLHAQGIDVYFIDNHSTDNTRNIAEEHPACIHVETFPVEDTGEYNWFDILCRKEKVAEMFFHDYQWIIHSDADEIRLSPWKHIPYLDALEMVGRAGYNAIDHHLFEFALTENGYDQWCRFEKAHGFQIKVWKSQLHGVNLADLGGHQAQFENRRVYPIPFIHLHFPLRSEEQARRKIFVDRLARFADSDLERGWHGHMTPWVDNPDKSVFTEDFIGLQEYSEEWAREMCIKYKVE